MSESSDTSQIVVLGLPWGRQRLIRKGLRAFFNNNADPDIEFRSKREEPKKPADIQAFIKANPTTLVFIRDDPSLFSYLSASGYRFGTLSFTQMRLNRKLKVRRVRIQDVCGPKIEFLCWPIITKRQSIFGIVTTMVEG